MKRNLTLPQAIQIREMRRKGVPVREICHLFGTNANTVYQIQVGMAYREAASVEGLPASVEGPKDRLDSTAAREGTAANVAGEPAANGGIKGEE
jgi:hypothetical protein